METKYRVALEILLRMVKFISCASEQRGQLNGDMLDLLTILDAKRNLYFGMGKGNLEDDPISIIDEVLSSPVQDINTDKVACLYCNITGGVQFTVKRAQEYIEEIGRRTYEINNIFNVSIDPCLDRGIEISLLANL